MIVRTLLTAALAMLATILLMQPETVAAVECKLGIFCKPTPGKKSPGRSGQEDIPPPSNTPYEPLFHRFDWEICNYTDDPVLVVFAYLDRDRRWVARGWEQIRSNDCEVVFSEAYDYDVVAYYAEGDHRRVRGDLALCIDPQHNFVVRDAANRRCEGRNRWVDFRAERVDGEKHVTPIDD